MLNGIDPILLFNFKKLTPAAAAATVATIPIVAETPSTFPLPIIPLYLSERLTGIYIDTENKSIEVATDTEALSSGAEPATSQRAIGNTVKIEMVAKRGSLGVMLLSALSDLVFPKLASKEYSITYLHGAVTVFGGLLHSLNITQDSGTSLYRISLELIKPSGKVAAAVPPTVPRASLSVMLGAG